MRVLMVEVELVSYGDCLGAVTGRLTGVRHLLACLVTTPNAYAPSPFYAFVFVNRLIFVTLSVVQEHLKGVIY